MPRYLVTCQQTRVYLVEFEVEARSAAAAVRIASERGGDCSDDGDGGVMEPVDLELLETTDESDFKAVKA